MRPKFALMSAAQSLLDLVFPPTCGNCGRVDFRFCADCQQLVSEAPLKLITKPVEFLDNVAATGRHAGILQIAIQSFKYEGAVALGCVLARRLVTVLHHLPWSFDAIVPVPLAEGRLEERGYNQALLLSQHVERALKRPCRPGSLSRIRETSQQARLSEDERRDNVWGAFVASDDLAGRSVLLVDDVVTTGSTLSACAAALRDKDVLRIYAVAVSSA